MTHRAQLGPDWRVVRISGVLVPGFTKRFDATLGEGLTSWWGVPVGRFRIAPSTDGGIELRYHRWPVVDVVSRAPSGAERSIPSAGFLRVGRRRLRFCRFALVPTDT